MAATTVPITVEPEAAARVKELGLEEPLQRMLEHTRDFVPGLLTIQVTLEFDPDEVRDPTIVLWPCRRDPGLEDDDTDRSWGRWLAAHYSPDVNRHFVLISLYESANGR